MKAFCPHYANCSGCSLQQFPYVKQLHDKQKLILTQFASSASKSASPIKPICPSPKEFGYRSSTKLCLHEDELGRRSIGLYQRASKRVLNIMDCPVHAPEINRLLAKLFPFGSKLPAPFYQHHRKGFQSGRLKFLTIRFCPTTGSFGIIISHSGVAREDLAAWARQIKIPHLCIYESRLTAADADLIISRDAEHLAGEPTFTFAAAGQTFHLSPLAFVQANASLSPQFIATITEGLEGGTLLDLYGGFGAYSFAISDRFKKIHVVEANEQSIGSGKRLAAEKQLTQLELHAVSVENFLQGLDQEARRSVTHIIVNPPRSGLSAQVGKALEGSAWPQIQRMIYVSCDPKTLRRDLQQLLGKGGWLLESLAPFDMFPQTEHLELVAKLRRNPAAPRQAQAKEIKASRPQKQGAARARQRSAKSQSR